MRSIQGALIVASTLQIVLGFSGLWRNVARLAIVLSALCVFCFVLTVSKLNCNLYLRICLLCMLICHFSTKLNSCLKWVLQLMSFV